MGIPSGPAHSSLLRVLRVFFPIRGVLFSYNLRAAGILMEWSAEKVNSVMQADSTAEHEPIPLKNGIARLDPVPIAQGGFSQIYRGVILNPYALVAERVLWGDENPRVLGVD